MRNHTRGQIVLAKDILGDLVAKVYTGCPYFDDYYICSVKDAQRISNELRGVSNEQL